MIDKMLTLTGAGEKYTQKTIAAQFGVSEMWLSCIINSDAFQARLAERKTELVDPLLRGQLDEAMKGLVNKSIDILRDQLAKKPTFDNALEVFKAASKGLGLGQKSNVNIQVNGDNSLVSVLSGMNNKIPEPIGNVIEGEVKVLGKVDGGSPAQE